MAQIVKEPGAGEIIGSQFGTGLSSGLSQGLQLLMNQRVQDLAQRNLQQRLGQGLQPLFGEQAQQYSQLPLELLSPLVKELSRSKESSAKAAPGLRKLIPQLSEEDAAKVASLTPGLQLEFYRNYARNPEALESVLQEVKPSPLLQQTKTRALNQEQKLDNRLNKMASKSQVQVPENIQNQTIPISKEQLVQPAQVEAQPLKLSNAKSSRSVDQTFLDRAKEVLKERIEPRDIFPEPQTFAERAKKATEEKEARKESKKLEERTHKEGMKIYNDINKAAKSAKEDRIRLDEIMELNEKGNLGFPILNSIIKTVGKGVFGHGIDLSFLMTADAQKLDKLSNDFIKNAKEYFGNRLTDLDLKNYLTTLPNLMQSKGGRREVIRNMRIFLDAKELRQKAANQILKANKNKFPENYEGLIEEIAGPELNNLASEYKASPALRAQEPSIPERLLQGIMLSY